MNKCSSCGLVFPYLMALLGHNCLKVEVVDEPSMPELCPEKPVGEVQYSGADDIPILSPAEATRDDVQARRLSIAEAVVREVSVETFDVSDYQDKWCGSPSKPKTKQKPAKMPTSTAEESSGNNLLKAIAMKLDKTLEKATKGSKEKPLISVNTSLPASSSNKSLKKVVSPQNRQEVNKNQKVSDIFKEVKRRGRKRQKTKVLPCKPLPKVGLRRSSLSSLVVSNNKTNSRKTRSSNFVMLMKEWEKLEKEGAVAVGKRTRQWSNSNGFGYVDRSSRSRNSDINTESSNYDSSSQDSEVETFIRKTRRTSLVETVNHSSPDKDNKDSKKLVLLGKIKTEKDDSNVEIKPLKNNIITDRSKETQIVDEEVSISLVKEETVETILKRKPGRPRFKSITTETAEHINETIESIITMSSESRESESIICKTEPTKDLKSKPVEHEIKTKVDEDLKLLNVTNTIYNVSVGNAEVFSVSSNNVDTEERTSINESSEQTSVPANSDSSVLVSDNGLERDKKVENKSCENSKSSKIQNTVANNTFGGVLDTAASSLQENQTVRGKRKLSFSEEEKSDTSLKRKEVKTKQLSIADYLSISQFVSRSSLSVNTSDGVDKKPKDKPLNGNKTDQIISANGDMQNTVTVPPKTGDEINVCSLPEVATVADNGKKDLNVSRNKKKVRRNSDDKPSSPGSVSSREDVALSVIRDKVIQKKKKKLKLKKLMKNKQIQLADKTCKIIKPTILSAGRRAKKDKIKKFNKKIEVGVSRNRWEVSVVDNKSKPVEILCEDDSKQGENSNNVSSEQVKKFYCATCDQKFESSYVLYQHQMTAEHKRNSALAEQQINMPEDSDPVKYCKSIGNIINDLEKRTLNVAKAMYQLKQSDPASEAPPVAESSSSVADWPHCPTPAPTTQQQPWDVDAFSTGSSLGSIMDTVNKLLSSEQETMPPYSWSDLQLAMGASDEEMAMLEQLGEHSLQEDYVYDSSQPVSEWLPPQEGSSNLTDLDHQESSSAAAPSASEVKKLEPLSDCEDSKVCRNALGRTRRLLGEYETKEMVCPTCNRHFLGLLALQTHIGWSHCAPVLSSSRLVSGLKRRALDEMDRRLVCFVCKEIVPSASKLETHIQTQHTKKSEEPVVSESAEKLRSKMSLALGGLVDRALNKMLGSNKALSEPSTSQAYVQADLNTGALQLLGRLCAARKRVGSDNIKSVTVGTRLSAELVQLVGRIRRETAVPRPDVKPTNLLDHLAVCSSDMQQRPYACPICDLRFLIPSTRNRHIARAHGKYGRRYDQDGEDCQAQEDFDSGWKESLDANDDGSMLPLCSDCGLSFQSIHEVIQHRIEDHPRRYSADEDSKPSVVNNKHVLVESSCEAGQHQEPLETLRQSDVKLLPVSDNAVDSTSTSKKKPRGRPSKRKPGECEKKHVFNRKSDRRWGGKKIETANATNNEGDNNSNTDTILEERKSPETDQHSTKNSSEENLAELSKKLDRRKVRMGNMAEEAVREKAEAALRELNLSRKIKSTSSPAKWGIDSMKFTKHISTSVSSSPVNGSSSKARFASLVEKKWKAPELDFKAPKSEPQDVNSDIYDFRDEDLDKKPFQQLKESHSPEVVNSESNKLNKSVNFSGNLKKISQTSKLSLENS